MSDGPLEERKEYTVSELSESMLDPSPFAQLQGWLRDAHSAGVTEPNAMCLATTDAHGRPSARMVLLRDLDERGLSFFTNYLSRKGKELSQQPFGSVCFWWGGLERQVRVEGRIEKVPTVESDAYFASRPRDSQLASSASPQSQVIFSREELESRVSALSEMYDSDIPRPDIWGGFRLIPDTFEFWQGREARLHDRLVYRLERDQWEIVRLAP